MPKSNNQKKKLIYILQYLREETDEAHTVSMKQIIDYLARYGINAERKSIYSDIEALDQMGYEIEYQSEAPKGYRLITRDFEIPELKLLVDAVQASKFISEKQTNKLISKLEKFASRHEANILQRQVMVKNRVKSKSVSSFYAVDEIHRAIHSNRAIEFEYYKWDINKKLVLRQDKKYFVSPWHLVWDAENYYLLGFDNIDTKIKYFRVDKMKNIEVTDTLREGKQEYEKIDLAKLSSKTFSMFEGKADRITLLVENEMVGVILDRFGADIPVLKADDTHVTVSVEVDVSQQFYGWLTGLSGRVVLLEPESQRKAYVEYIEKIQKQYK